MGLDLQKAGIWKRVSAYLFDMIILGIVAIGIAFLLSGLLGYDKYGQAVDKAYETYEERFGITFELTAEEYSSMSEEELARYDQAYEALIADEEAMYAYNMVINLTLVILTISILIAFVALEYVVPLLFKNGQTLGKKIFGICVMRTDSVRLTTLQLFVRSILGKFTLETMVPVLIIVMLYFNSIGLTGTIVLGLLLLLQIIVICATAGNSAIHDLLSGTVVVDFHSQKIFACTEDLVEYKALLAAERAARRDY
jgi:uncharacterized RDD family membrane protein YckC